MAIRISINSKKVKNPLLVFLVTVVGLLIGLLVFVLLLFVLFPAIWFATIALVLAMMLLPYLLPKVNAKYRILIQKKNDSSGSG